MAVDAGLMPPRPRRTPYAPAQSLQFRAAAGDYLTRTPAVATPDRTRGIFVVAMKPSRALLPSTLERLFFVSGASIMRGGGEADGRGYFSFGYGGYYRYSTASFHRDPTAFTLLVCSYDTNAPAGERVWWYNGLTRLPAPAGTEFGAGEALPFGTTVPHYIGYDGTYNFDGVLSDVRWFAGMSLQNGDHASEDFFEDDGFGGLYLVRPATAGYGVNGFWLDGEIAGGLALDKSGNGNHFTASGVTECLDSPGDKADANVGNYARLSPLVKVGTVTFSNAGLRAVQSTDSVAVASIPMRSGKWCCEVGVGSFSGNPYFGVLRLDLDYRVNPWTYTISCLNGGGWYDGNGTYHVPPGAATYGAGDILGLTWDADTGTLIMRVNNVLEWTYTNASWAGKPVVFSSTPSLASGTIQTDWKFGSNGFTYPIPTEIKPLVTCHLPAKLPKKPRTQMGVLAWTGNGTVSRAITGICFQPDFVWGKRRVDVSRHMIFDSLRGVGKHISSNQAEIEETTVDTLTLFDADGFSVGADANGWLNANTKTYVAWCLGGLTHMTGPEIPALVATTGATITPSNIAYDATLGMAIITYAGNGTAGAKLPNPMGQAPSMMIAKSRSYSGADWDVYHSALGATKRLFLNQTAAVQTTGASWNNTAPTPNVITLGDGADVNLDAATYVLYLFANTDAIKVGSYVGNGNIDGPFVDLGGRPLWFMSKRIDAIDSGWMIVDGVRTPNNSAGNPLQANTPSAEFGVAYQQMDFVASGVKLRHDTSYGYSNVAGGSYIYLAFIDRYFGGGNVAQGRAR